MKNQTEIIKKRYNRIASLYDLFEAPMEFFTASWRAEITREVSGKTLEVGVGTGKNLPYYGPNIELVGIDFSPKMLVKAGEKLNVLKHNNKITLLEMDVQELDFEDDSFDSVITSCVFCSVPIPVSGLKEIRRVCKNKGKIVMLEHVRSKNNLVGALMDMLNPIPLYLYGANINRDTLGNLKKAGFRDMAVRDMWLDIFKKITVNNTK